MIYEGESYEMESDPFVHYLVKSSPKIQTYPVNTALCRGYLGKWEIGDKKLYLIKIEGRGAKKMKRNFELED